MSQRPRKILIADDEVGILQSLRILLTGAGYEVAIAEGGREALDVLGGEKPDIVLTDIRMPGATGMEVLARAREVDPEIAVILMTAEASLQSAVRAVNEGAYYYLQKPFANDELLAICRRACEARELRVENRELKKEIRRREGGKKGRPIGKSRGFIEVMKLAETVAPTESTVLITGESGTGKEVAARYIHTLSDRSEGPFFSINCGALPESLLESELFGHVKGAFTGAVRDREGLLVAASGGTFFMDEIGEMSPATQVKLLRALQEREVIPVGATQAVPVRVRLIAATNRNLEEEIRRGNFRSDLYYRLNVIALHMPPLRERREDVPLLVHHFLGELAASAGRAADALGDGSPGAAEKWNGTSGGESRQVEGEEPPSNSESRRGAHHEPIPAKGISEEAMEVLLRYDWPGNVRELENALERAAVLTSGDLITVDALPERVRNTPPPRLTGDTLPPNPSMEMIERAYIHWVLVAEQGNKTKAAEVLGIDPSTLYRKLNRYGLQDV